MYRSEKSHIRMTKIHFDDYVQNIGMILLYGFSNKSEGVH